MSSYANYDQISQYYDETRVPIGGEILLDCLSACGVPLGSAKLLDAGCGSGAYAALLADEVGSIDAIDRSTGMLAAARRRLAVAGHGGRVRLCQGNIDELPFAADRFDAVMINQVLHHLENDATNDFPRHRRVFHEMRRVLRPGGVFVVNFTSHRQLRHGFWYYDLVSEAQEALFRLCISTPRLEELLTDAGFEILGRHVPLDGVMQGKSYFDLEGPLHAAWRQGDSFWELATPAQVSVAEKKVRGLKREGRLQDYFEERDSARRQVGQFTFCLARNCRSIAAQGIV